MGSEGGGLTDEQIEEVASKVAQAFGRTPKTPRRVAKRYQTVPRQGEPDATPDAPDPATR